MKKIFMSLAALMMMAAPVMTSCSSDLDEEAPEVVCPENGTHEETITIAFPDQTETRVAVDDDHKLTGWEVGDEVTLVRTNYDESMGEGGPDCNYTLDATYTFKCTDAASGTFTGTLPDGYSVNDCQLAFYNATGFATNGSSEFYFSPKSRASQNMKDVVMLVAKNDGNGHFAMKILGSILQVTNVSNINITASVKFKWNNFSKYYDNNLISYDGFEYNGWEINLYENQKYTFTFSKNATTYVYIPVYNIEGGSTNYSVGLSAEEDEDDECSIVPFKANPGNAKLFKMAVDFGKGTAKATIGEGLVDVNWVQLWRKGPKFAEYNVGVTDESDIYGGYYCWGGSVNMDSQKVYKDGESALSGNDDTATKLWGSAWRMPTQLELQALLDNCVAEWTTVNGVYGRKFTGKGDYASNSVFLPAAGLYLTVYGTHHRNEDGYYLSSTPVDSDQAYTLRFISESDSQYVASSVRNTGFSVRAVLAE